MKVVFLVPAADLMRSFIYRLGAAIYGQRNNITGPLILGGILKDAGHEVEVYEELYVDVDYQSMDAADVFCIYTMSSNSIRAYKIADFLRNEMGKRVIIGGMHASARPEEAALHADQVVVGEAEGVIEDVVEGRRNEKIVEAEPPADLDSVPFPDYTLLQTPTEAANVMTTRGCTHRCSFCTTSRMFSPYRQRSVENVIEELRMYKNIGFEYVNFQDDNFSADRDRTKELLRRMIAEDLVFRETFFFSRIDSLEDEELLGLMGRANLKRVLIGFETFHQEGLNRIHKGQQVMGVGELKERTRRLSRHGIKIIASIVLGIDSDTKEDIRRSTRICSEIHAYQFQPAILTPFPGTEDFDRLEKNGRIITKDWQLYDMTNAVFEPKHMSAPELEKEAMRAAVTFYSFRGAFQIMRLFGVEAGLRRLGLALMAKSVPLFFNVFQCGGSAPSFLNRSES